MNTRHRPVITEAEQALLDGVQVRLIESGEREHFDQLIVTEHYLGNAQLVGEQLRYAAEYQGQWVALISWRCHELLAGERIYATPTNNND
jgi:hypothetical protein